MNISTGIKLDIFTVLTNPTRRLIVDTLSELDKIVNELANIV